MPKQLKGSKPKAKKPSKKKPKTPVGFRNPPPPIISPEIMQPSTNSRPPFNRQAGEEPDLERAKKASDLFNDILKPTYKPPPAPKTQMHTLSLCPAAMQKTICNTLLTEHQNEVKQLREALAAEKQENAKLRAQLAAANIPPLRKRKKLGGKLCLNTSVDERVGKDGE